jgi:hypothetical protein
MHEIVNETNLYTIINISHTIWFICTHPKTYTNMFTDTNIKVLLTLLGDIILSSGAILKW